MNTVCKRKKFQLSIMLGLIIGVYLPLFIVLNVKFDTINKSLSGMGWEDGNLLILFSYIVLTVPLILYEIFFFIKNSGKKNKLLAIFSILGGLCMAIGAAIPCAEAQKFVKSCIPCFA